MPNKTRKYSTKLVAFFLFFILVMTWFYPFSIFSINKSYSFTADPVTVDEYTRELNEFITSFENDLEEAFGEDNINLTLDRTRYLASIFEQEWISSKDPIKMDLDMLSNNLDEVKSARNALLELIVREDYNYEQREYLVGSIDSLLSVEEQINKIKMSSFSTRSTLNRQFRNLHVSFISQLTFYEIFYEQVQNDR
ncbi:hypothetical protein [Oceanobacillus sp. CAU 1775]